MPTAGSPHRPFAGEPVIPRFIDQTLMAGIHTAHHQGGKYLSGLDETLGAGACALDYDNDGWTDLFIIGGSGQNRYYGRPDWWQHDHGNVLYRNQGDGTFGDVTAIAGLTDTGWGMGCASADLDNDGDAELFITNKGANRLYRNNGDGTFTDISDAAGIADTSWSTSVAFADYDRDGLLDIYVVNYIDYRKGQRTYEAQSGFKPSLPLSFDANLYDSVQNQLFHNEGELHFRDVTTDAGVGNRSGRGLSAIWTDIDADLYPDLFVSNDSGLPNTLYLNQRNGRFAGVEVDYRVNTTQRTAGLASGDIDNDGDIELAAGTAGSIAPLLYLRGTSPWPLQSTARAKNDGFIDAARMLGFGNERYNSGNGWGIGFADMNNDGWLDLFLANGLATPDADSAAVAQGQPNQLRISDGRGRFWNATGKAGIALQDSQSSRGVLPLDYDNDGDMDLFVTNNNDLPQLLENVSQPGRWLGVRLTATRGSRDAFGARLRLETTRGSQYRVIGGSQGMFTDDDKRVHFGLGTAAGSLVLDVEWPDGSVDSYSGLPVNQKLCAHHPGRACIQRR